MKEIFYFTANWCGPCSMFGPIIEEVRSTGIPIRKIDVDVSRTLVDAYGVKSVPTCVFLENGQEVKRTVGVSTKEQLIQTFNSF